MSRKVRKREMFVPLGRNPGGLELSTPQAVPGLGESGSPQGGGATSPGIIFISILILLGMSDRGTTDAG